MYKYREYCTRFFLLIIQFKVITIVTYLSEVDHKYKVST